MSERTTKTFWYADLENLQVVKSIGLSTQTPDVWWFAELGYSLTVGKQVFNSENEAKQALGLAASGALRNFVLKTRNILDYLSTNTTFEKSAKCCWCKSGSFVLDGAPFQSLPPQYKFKCTNCGAEAILKPKDIRE